MPFSARLRSLLRNAFDRDRVERDLARELEAYVGLLVDEKIRAGLDPEEAARAARLELGGMEQVKESVHDVRLGVWIETTLQDLRFAVRALARSPGTTAAAVVALALGIGATASVFTVVNAVLLRPLPYRNGDRLVVILHRGVNPVSPANYLDWRRQSFSFEEMSAAELWTPDITGVANSEKIQGLRVTPNTFPMLGIQPVVGRVFRRESAEGDREVLIGYRLWRVRFGGDARILGRAIILDGVPYTVAGVMPEGFAFPPFWAAGVELWAPLALGDRALNREGSSLRVFALLAPGVSLGQARAEVAAITGRLETQFPGTNVGITVLPLKERVVGDVRPALLVLLGAVGFVLLIACANVAHMLLARASARRKEVAVRAALGASRGRLIRQFLTESLVLAAAGGGAGLLLAVWATRALVALAPASIPRADAIGLDWRVVAFAGAISILTGITFGLVPAFESTTRGLSEPLRDLERGSTDGRGRNRLRRLLVASECALALVLLIGAGLLIRTFVALEAIDPGFNPRGVLSLLVSVTGSAQGDPARRPLFYRELLQRVRSIPGVESASAINHLPLAGDIWGWPFFVEGRPLPARGQAPTATYRVVFPGYFRTMQMRLLHGRDIAETDDRNAPGAVVVNERLAQRHWPGEDPIGKRITIDDRPAPGKTISWLTVVGVVKNAVRAEWAAAPEDEIFLPYLQTRNYLERRSSVFSYMTLVVRTSGAPARLASAVRNAVWSVDRNVTVSQVVTMDEVVAEAGARPRFNLVLLATFAGVALILAAVGIAGVMGYSVARRTREIGIRMALGARRAEILSLVLGEGMRVVLAGAGVGLVAAILLTRSMSSLLYGVRATDPATFAAVSALLALIALLACYLPARRATRIDPLVALRHE